LERAPAVFRAVDVALEDAALGDFLLVTFDEARFPPDFGERVDDFFVTFPPRALLLFPAPPAPFFVEEERPAEDLDFEALPVGILERNLAPFDLEPARRPAFEPFPDVDLVRVDLESAFDALPFGAFVRLDLESFEDVALESLPRVGTLDVFAVDNLDFDPLARPAFFEVAFKPFLDADLVRVDLESAFDALPFDAFVRLNLESFEDVALESLPRVGALDVFAVDNLDFDPSAVPLPRPDFALFVSADFVVFSRVLEAPLPVAARVFSPFAVF